MDDSVCHNHSFIFRGFHALVYTWCHTPIWMVNSFNSYHFLQLLLFSDRRWCTLGYERASFAVDVWDWSVGLLQLQCCSGAARRYCGGHYNTVPVASLSYKSRLLSLCETQEKKDGRLTHAQSGKSPVLLSSVFWILIPTELRRRCVLDVERR